MEVRLLTVRSRRGFAILNVALCLRAHACAAAKRISSSRLFLLPVKRIHAYAFTYRVPCLWTGKKIEMLEFVEDARRHGHDINKACVESPSLVS